MPYIHLISLGCAKNQVDTEEMLGDLLPRGCHLCVEPDDADVIIINTCAFIEQAREETLAVIHDCAHNKKEGQMLIVCGCYPERYRDNDARAIPAVDHWLGIKEEKRIPTLIARAGHALTHADDTRRIRVTPPHYAYVRIADGCAHACAFCVIPTIRGPYVSRTRQDICNEVRQLVDEGVFEINCIAQDTAAYGHDLTPHDSLADLLEELADIDGLGWLRVQYMYPAGLSDRLITLMHEHPRICPYFDIPLQHISDHVLRAMKRPGASATRKHVERIQSHCPDAVLRSTFIVGFPGETQADIDELCAFMRDVRFHHVGVFTYSPEEGTSAFPQGDPVSQEEKEARHALLMATQQDISYARNAEYIGTNIPVLIDAVEDTKAYGRTRGDAPDVDNCVHLDVPPQTRPGACVTARITACEPYDLFGELITKSS